MFKMLLQRWYNLSAPGLEAAMCVRLSFIRFAGLPFQSSVPDETAFCRFRNELLASGLDHKLLGQINKQLEALRSRRTSPPRAGQARLRRARAASFC